MKKFVNFLDTKTLLKVLWLIISFVSIIISFVPEINKMTTILWIRPILLFMSIFFGGVYFYKYFFQKAFSEDKEKEIREKLLKEQQPDEQTQKSKNELDDVLNIIQPYFDDDEICLFYTITGDVGQYIDGFKKSFLIKTGTLKKLLDCIRNQIGCAKNIQELSKTGSLLNKWVYYLQEIWREFENEKTHWVNNYEKKSNFKELKDDYNRFIDRLKDFYDNNKWSRDQWLKI